MGWHSMWNGHCSGSRNNSLRKRRHLQTTTAGDRISSRSPVRRMAPKRTERLRSLSSNRNEVRLIDKSEAGKAIGIPLREKPTLPDRIPGCLRPEGYRAQAPTAGTRRKACGPEVRLERKARQEARAETTILLRA